MWIMIAQRWRNLRFKNLSVHPVPNDKLHVLTKYDTCEKNLNKFSTSCMSVSQGFGKREKNAATLVR